MLFRKGQQILNLGVNLLMFPLQAKPRMSAMFVHIENATRGRFSKWLAHGRKIHCTGHSQCPWCRLRGGDSCTGLSVGSPRHPGADKTLTSQSRRGCVQTGVELPSEQKRETRDELCPACSSLHLLFFTVAILSTCTKGVVSALAHSSLSSWDLSGPQWSWLHHTEKRPLQTSGSPQLWCSICCCS